jgi:predicted O-methyltransferase YrrM
MNKDILHIIIGILLLIIFFKIHNVEKLNNFEGTAYRLSDNWNSIIPLDLQNRPIKYLEIGAFHGANVISVAESYGLHPDSKLYCIDPWINYDEYPEYKEEGMQENNYSIFMRNIRNNNLDNKVITLRGFSSVEIPKLENESFDIIFIDGNHEAEFVLEDAVLSFPKLKVGGYMIFDDYYWDGGKAGTDKGIDAFFNGYFKRIIEINRNYNNQSFLQKIR